MMSNKIIRLKEVLDRCGLARSTVYDYVARGLFPKPVPLGARAIGWMEDEISNWIDDRSKLVRRSYE
jgi:prophage regulatory protein